MEMSKMRKVKYSDGFLLSFFLNLLLNYWLGLVALALWVLHLWPGIPLFISLIALGAWVVTALITTVILSFAANSAPPEIGEQRNANPYSAKTSDFLPPRQYPDTQAKGDAGMAERDVCAAESGNATYEAFYPAYIPAGPTAWAEISHCLFDAAALIHMTEREFDILEEQVLSGARDPGHTGSPQSDSDRLYWFLDGMDELGYIAYQSNNAAYTLIADSLSLSAVNQGLPAIPGELAKERTNENLFIGNPDMAVGGTAARLIAALVTAWRVFMISDGTAGCYIGVVSHENADNFAAMMRGCFAMVEHEYSIELLMNGMSMPNKNEEEK